MHKISFCVLSIIIGLILGTAAVVSGQAEDEICVPLGPIILEPLESVEAKRTPTEFPHSRHMVVVDCKTCHHMWIGDEQIQTCTTSGCHDVDVSPTISKKSNVAPDQAILYYKTAFHQMCIGCHKEMKMVNEELEMSYKRLDEELPRTGPTGCIQCHPKD